MGILKSWSRSSAIPESEKINSFANCVLIIGQNVSHLKFRWSDYPVIPVEASLLHSWIPIRSFISMWYPTTFSLMI